MADVSRGHRIRSPSRNPIPDFLGSSQFSSLQPGSSNALGPGRSRGVKSFLYICHFEVSGWGLWTVFCVIELSFGNPYGTFVTSKSYGSAAIVFQNIYLMPSASSSLGMKKP